MLEEAIKMAKDDRDYAMLELLVPMRKELAALRQALKDIVDFDIDEVEEPDGMCAVEGPKKIARCAGAWKRAIDAVGPRDSARFEGDKP